MNSLSWFLYFAGVVEGVGVLLAFLALTTLFLTVITVSNSSVWDGHKWVRTITKTHWTFGSLSILCLVLVALIPSKNTLYAIAASELGEEVIKSNIGTKVTSALEQWIDKQLEQKK